MVPRSSTFKNYGIIQTNSCGIIDGTYCGDDDMWRMPVYAVRDTVIHVNDRICQFRILKISRRSRLTRWRASATKTAADSEALENSNAFVKVLTF